MTSWADLNFLVSNQKVDYNTVASTGLDENIPEITSGGCYLGRRVEKSVRYQNTVCKLAVRNLVKSVFQLLRKETS